MLPSKELAYYLEFVRALLHDFLMLLVVLLLLQVVELVHLKLRVHLLQQLQFATPDLAHPVLAPSSNLLLPPIPFAPSVQRISAGSSSMHLATTSWAQPPLRAMFLPTTSCPSICPDLSIHPPTSGPFHHSSLLQPSTGPWTKAIHLLASPPIRLTPGPSPRLAPAVPPVLGAEPLLPPAVAQSVRANAHPLLWDTVLGAEPLLPAAASPGP